MSSRMSTMDTTYTPVSQIEIQPDTSDDENINAQQMDEETMSGKHVFRHQVSNISSEGEAPIALARKSFHIGNKRKTGGGIGGLSLSQSLRRRYLLILAIGLVGLMIGIVAIGVWGAMSHSSEPEEMISTTETYETTPYSDSSTPKRINIEDIEHDLPPDDQVQVETFLNETSGASSAPLQVADELQITTEVTSVTDEQIQDTE